MTNQCLQSPGSQIWKVVSRRGLWWTVHYGRQEVVVVGGSLCTGQEAAYLNVESMLCGLTMTDVSHLEQAQSLRLWSRYQTHSAYTSIEEIFCNKPPPRLVKPGVAHKLSQPLDAR